MIPGFLVVKKVIASSRVPII